MTPSLLADLAHLYRTEARRVADDAEAVRLDAIAAELGRAAVEMDLRAADAAEEE